MKHTALVNYHIIHRRIMSHLFERYNIVVLRTIIKHIFMKSVVRTMKFKIWLYEGEHIFIKSISKENH